MSLLRYANSMKWLLPIFVLAMSSACCKAHVEVRYISVKPKLEPLPPETSQAMQPDSTELLKRAESWSENSEQLLDSVTSN